METLPPRLEPSCSCSTCPELPTLPSTLPFVRLYICWPGAALCWPRCRQNWRIYPSLHCPALPIGHAPHKKRRSALCPNGRKQSDRCSAADLAYRLYDFARLDEDFFFGRQV